MCHYPGPSLGTLVCYCRISLFRGSLQKCKILSKWIYPKNVNIHDICIYHTSNWTGEPVGYARDIFMTSRGHVMTSSRDLEMIRKITNTFLASVKILGQLQGCVIPLLKALFNAHLWWNSHYMYHASLYVKNCLKILFFHIFYTKSHFSHP